jgi:hypothetical protein
MLHPTHHRNHCKAQELFIQALAINPQDDNTVLRHAMSHHFMKELVSGEGWHARGRLRRDPGHDVVQVGAQHHRSIRLILGVYSNRGPKLYGTSRRVASCWA